MRKYVNEEDMQWIKNGTKKYLAKFETGFWKDVIPDDSIIIVDGTENEIEVKVVKTEVFSTFGDAWFRYRDNNNLHPVFPELSVTSMDDVNNYFYQKHGPDVKNHRVIVVEINVV